MPIFVNNCPRCAAENMTFDVWHSNPIPESGGADWMVRFEVSAVCRRCKRTTVFLSEFQQYAMSGLLNNEKFWKSNVTLNGMFAIIGFIGLKDLHPHLPPEHLPKAVEDIFREGSTCLSVACYNAASTMFRLCLDLATKDLLPDAADTSKDQPNSKQRRDLGLRLPWLIEKGLLPESLRDLASVVKEDGNEGAHVGSLGKVEAEDLLDFTVVLLERLYTEPARVELAAARRIERRKPKG